MKLSKAITWAARGLGLGLLAALLAIIIYSIVMIKPETEENIGYIFLIMICVALAIFLTIFLLVAWKRETTGGVFYVVFAGLMLLVITIVDITATHTNQYLYLYLYVAPIAITGILFLISARMKRANPRLE